MSTTGRRRHQTRAIVGDTLFFSVPALITICLGFFDRVHLVSAQCAVAVLLLPVATTPIPEKRPTSASVLA